MRLLGKVLMLFFHLSAQSIQSAGAFPIIPKSMKINTIGFIRFRLSNERASSSPEWGRSEPKYGQ